VHQRVCRCLQMEDYCSNRGIAGKILHQGPPSRTEATQNHQGGK
jgi:hypothetical protein